MKADKVHHVHQGKFTVILRKEEEGYSVRCVELPGAISEGRQGKRLFRTSVKQSRAIWKLSLRKNRG